MACLATYTNHHAPWALVRRGGATEGKRPFTRMAFLVDTVVGPDGKAIALRGYIANGDLKGWSKSLRRIEWSDIVKQWRRAPSPADVRNVRSRMKVALTARPS